MKDSVNLMVEDIRSKHGRNAKLINIQLRDPVSRPMRDNANLAVRDVLVKKSIKRSKNLCSKLRSRKMAIMVCERGKKPDRVERGKVVERDTQIEKAIVQNRE